MSGGEIRYLAYGSCFAPPTAVCGRVLVRGFRVDGVTLAEKHPPAMGAAASTVASERPHGSSQDACVAAAAPRGTCLLAEAGVGDAGVP